MELLDSADNLSLFLWALLVGEDGVGELLAERRLEAGGEEVGIVLGCLEVARGVDAFFSLGDGETRLGLEVEVDFGEVGGLEVAFGFLGRWEAGVLALEVEADLGELGGMEGAFWFLRQAGLSAGVKEFLGEVGAVTLACCFLGRGDAGVLGLEVACRGLLLLGLLRQGALAFAVSTKAASSFLGWFWASAFRLRCVFICVKSLTPVASTSAVLLRRILRFLRLSPGSSAGLGGDAGSDLRRGCLSSLDWTLVSGGASRNLILSFSFRAFNRLRSSTRRCNTAAVRGSCVAAGNVLVIRWWTSNKSSQHCRVRVPLRRLLRLRERRRLVPSGGKGTAEGELLLEARVVEDPAVVEVEEEPS